MNKFIVGGRLVDEPNLKHTPTNKAVAQAQIAVNRNYKDSQTGERVADFFTIQVWGKYGENFSDWAGKGDYVNIEGEIRNNNYTDNQGVRHYGMIVNVSQFEIVDDISRRRGNQLSQENNNSVPDFGSNYSDAFGGGFPPSPMDISDDDLPF